VIISSTMPSAKYSCSGSPLKLAKGNTAIDGLSGSGSTGEVGAARLFAATPRSRTRKTRTGRAMFLRFCSPMSSKPRSSLPMASSWTRAETQIPPGSANASRRAATLTPSPKMSPSSTTISPTLMPMRNSIRSSVATAVLRSAIALCIAVAQCNASTTLANSTNNPSPIVLTMRPWCSAILASVTSARIAASRLKVPPSSAPISRE